MEISGVRMLIGLLIGIALLIVLMLKTKIQGTSLSTTRQVKACRRRHFRR